MSKDKEHWDKAMAEAKTEDEKLDVIAGFLSFFAKKTDPGYGQPWPEGDGRFVYPKEDKEK